MLPAVIGKNDRNLGRQAGGALWFFAISSRTPPRVPHPFHSFIVKWVGEQEPQSENRGGRVAPVSELA